jgi:hypothetical protein
MDLYRHHVSGFFSQRSSAEQALAQLIQRGLHSEQLQIVTSSVGAATASVTPARRNKALKNTLFDTTIGAGIGIGMGALLAVALIVSEASLFYASPLLTSLALMGAGALIGGFLGRVIGASAFAGQPYGRSNMPANSATYSDVVLVAQTHNAQQTQMAREVIKATAGLVKDINMTPASAPQTQR